MVNILPMIDRDGVVRSINQEDVAAMKNRMLYDAVPAEEFDRVISERIISTGCRIQDLVERSVEIASPHTKKC